MSKSTGSFLAFCPEIVGCSAAAPTAEQAVELLRRRLAERAPGEEQGPTSADLRGHEIEGRDEAVARWVSFSGALGHCDSSPRGVSTNVGRGGKPS